MAALTAAAVARSIERAFPDLLVERCTPLGEGWDSSAWLVNERLVFRFPWRVEVADWLRRECCLLPRLAPALPVPVPSFDYVAQAGAPTDPALPFVGYPLLRGVSLDERPDLIAPESPLVAQLAGFLRALHAFPLAQVAACDLPYQDWHGWVARWIGWWERLRAAADPHLTSSLRAFVAGTAEAHLAELGRQEENTALVHHDLAPEHILSAPDGTRLTGVIDWGDMTIGDPAIDCAGLARFAAGATLDAVLAAYGRPGDTGMRQRARWYAALGPFHLLTFGLHVGDRARIRQARDELAALQAAGPLATRLRRD